MSAARSSRGRASATKGRSVLRGIDELVRSIENRAAHDADFTVEQKASLTALKALVRWDPRYAERRGDREQMEIFCAAQGLELTIDALLHEGPRGTWTGGFGPPISERELELVNAYRAKHGRPPLPKSMLPRLRKDAEVLLTDRLRDHVNELARLEADARVTRFAKAGGDKTGQAQRVSGEKTAERVMRLWRELERVPARKRASRIAALVPGGKRGQHLSDKQVRNIINAAKKQKLA